jgi:hypothetical protein
MGNVKFCVLSLVAVISGLAIAVSAQSATEEFAVRTVPEQVILYTIYRGSYDKTGESIGKLFGLARQKGLIPCGPPSFAYLNNPMLTAPEHYLTEIRIPVKEEALKSAGTLGAFTDIKKLPAMDVVVATKPSGQADPSKIYESLNIWMAKHSYLMIDSLWETFLDGGGGSYAQMKSEIMVPVMKLNEEKSKKAASQENKKK